MAFARLRGHHFLQLPRRNHASHVVMYLGGDKILQAPQTGQNVGYFTLSEFSGQTASVRRIAVP